MNNQELYINGRAVDLPQTLGVRLNRALINPGELNTKNAEFSYSIVLPPTNRNSVAFALADVEETKNKFNRTYAAEYISDGVRIFIGRFRVTEITADGFKGNLYVPERKSVKDIFGELKLNENAPYRIPFGDFVASINQYNAAAAAGPQAAIFPYVLYGLLPKVPLNRNANMYSPRTVWDDTVRIGIADLPPSINPVAMLRHIFESQGYNLVGSALTDERIARVYMSYRNDPAYVQPWNYGTHAVLRVSGVWSSTTNRRTGGYFLERGVNQGYGGSGDVAYAVDMLDSTNAAITINEDKGGNVFVNELEDAAGAVWVNGQIRVPVAGFYKVRFGASVRVFDNNNWNEVDPATGIRHISGRSSEAANTLPNNAIEVRLSRDGNRGADFNLSSPKLNGVFYYNNMPQNQTFDENNIPKYYPQVTANGQLNLVDAAQDRAHLLGFAWGSHEGYQTDDYYNPRDTDRRFAQVLAAKPGQSWDAGAATDKPTRIAVQSPGWWKYGRVGTFENDQENPDRNIDYSGGPFENNADLDENGIAIPGAQGNVILYKFPLERYFTYRLVAPGHEGTAFLHNGTADVPVARVEFVNGVASFDTSFSPIITFNPRLTIMLKNEDFDINGTLVISRIMTEADATVIGWELTNRHAISLNNAPGNYSRRGQFDGSPADPNWTAQGAGACVVWLEAGELLTVSSVSSEGRYQRSNSRNRWGLVNHEIKFDLQVEAFRNDPAWYKVNLAGNGTGAMNWGDAPTFDTDSIDLVKFLHADTKTDEFIDNFVKAFNLKLSQIDDNTFSLDLKQTRRSVSALSVKLDNVASIAERINSPLGLPPEYRIGFTVDQDEQGFVESGDDGGGTFKTGVDDGGTPVEQKSNFSYNWFKAITQGNSVLQLPVITKSEAWDPLVPYAEAMAKRYTSQPYRFWYHNGNLPGVFTFNRSGLTLAQVSNELPGANILNYKNARFTLLDNFFTILINGASHYTEIEAYLTPAQYADLNGAIMGELNGDLYYIGQLQGYDPTGRNKTKIKLIRRI